MLAPSLVRSMTTFPRWIALLFVLPLAAGCVGSDAVKPLKVTPSPTVEPTPDAPQADKTKPALIETYTGSVDGFGTPLFSIDLPSSNASDDIKTGLNGSLRFELKFAPGGAASQLHVEVADAGAPDASGQPKVLGAKEGGPLVVIDVPRDKLVGVQQLGYRVFIASGSAGQNVEFRAAASLFNGTIPASFTAFNS